MSQYSFGFGSVKALLKKGIDKFMDNIRISPDEKITLNALESPNPFSRPGKQPPPVPVDPVPQPQQKQSRFQHYDDTVPSKQEEPVKVESTAPRIVIKESKPKQKAEAKPKPKPEPVAEKKLENMQAAEATDVVVPENPIQESRSKEGLPSYRCEFAGRDIFVGFPCYKTTNPVTAFAMIAMALDFGRDRIRFDMSIGDAMVYHSRNKLAQKFLETDAKYMLMIDDDIIPCIGRPAWMRSVVHSAKNVYDAPLQRHVLHRLIGSGKSIIGGAYFGRQEGAPLMCSDRDLAPKAKNYEDAIVPVDWVATGCILIHRRVFTDIEKKFLELKPEKPGDPFDFFHPIKSTMGEDVSFCYRAKQAGHQPHIDLGLPVFHVGYKTY